MSRTSNVTNLLLFSVFWSSFGCELSHTGAFLYLLINLFAPYKGLLTLCSSSIALVQMLDQLSSLQHGRQHTSVCRCWSMQRWYWLSLVEAIVSFEHAQMVHCRSRKVRGKQGKVSIWQSRRRMTAIQAMLVHLAALLISRAVRAISVTPALLVFRALALLIFLVFRHRSVAMLMTSLQL